VAISSASIPAVSFVVTAIMPARGHQTNETNIFDPARWFGFADCLRSKPDQREAPSIPKPYCKSFAIGRTNTEDEVKWHRGVTCVQHNAIKSCGIQREDPPQRQSGYFACYVTAIGLL
jgi:hypothetical protein